MSPHDEPILIPWLDRHRRLADRAFALQKRVVWLARHRSPALMVEPVIAAALDEIAEINRQFEKGLPR